MNNIKRKNINVRIGITEETIIKDIIKKNKGIDTISDAIRFSLFSYKEDISNRIVMKKVNFMDRNISSIMLMLGQYYTDIGFKGTNLKTTDLPIVQKSKEIIEQEIEMAKQSQFYRRSARLRSAKELHAPD